MRGKQFEDQDVNQCKKGKQPRGMHSRGVEGPRGASQVAKRLYIVSATPTGRPCLEDAHMVCFQVTPCNTPNGQEGMLLLMIQHRK